MWWDAACSSGECHHAYALRMVVVGVAAALPLAHLASVLVAKALVGVTSHDAGPCLLVPACAVAAGLLASRRPALSTARTEPAAALKDL